jgi:hypothetical protein
MIFEEFENFITAPYFPICVEIRQWAAPELAARLAFSPAWLTISDRGVCSEEPAHTNARVLPTGITFAWGRQTVGGRNPSTPESFPRELPTLWLLFPALHPIRFARSESFTLFQFVLVCVVRRLTHLLR